MSGKNDSGKNGYDHSKPVFDTGYQEATCEELATLVSDVVGTAIGQPHTQHEVCISTAHARSVAREAVLAGLSAIDQVKRMEALEEVIEGWWIYLNNGSEIVITDSIHCPISDKHGDERILN